MSYSVRLNPDKQPRQRKTDPLKKLKRSLRWKGRYTELRLIWLELKDRNRKIYLVLDSSTMWQITIKRIYKFGCNIKID